MIQLFSHDLVLKKLTKITINHKIESQYLKLAIHIESAPKYRDSIESGDRCVVPALVGVSLINGPFNAEQLHAD